MEAEAGGPGPPEGGAYEWKRDLDGPRLYLPGKVAPVRAYGGGNPGEQRGKEQLLSVQATDRSGSTRPVDIPTPLLEDSIQPGHGTPPYAVCDVWAEHPGYAMLLVEGVQIFDGVDTLQEMELSPLSEGESSLVQEQIREITGQSL